MIFWACPCGRFAALMPTRSACCGLRFASVLRTGLTPTLRMPHAKTRLNSPHFNP
ncbi:MAG: hypothetical protein NZ455_12590 [Bacteroidia bacterium]|nr:hypothetical protein [Bacteroidia bacterium]MDW8347366.1 hypothetical protein [Bacteroidia bacterium]